MKKAESNKDYETATNSNTDFNIGIAKGHIAKLPQTYQTFL